MYIMLSLQGTAKAALHLPAPAPPDTLARFVRSPLQCRCRIEHCLHYMTPVQVLDTTQCIDECCNLHNTRPVAVLFITSVVHYIPPVVHYKTPTVHFITPVVHYITPVQVLAYQQASPCQASPCKHGSCLAAGTRLYTAQCTPPGVLCCRKILAISRVQVLPTQAATLATPAAATPATLASTAST